MTQLARITPRQQATIPVGNHTMSALLYNRDKSGVPVVFIHGITSSIYFWEHGQTPYVRDNLQWYALSLPGHYPAAFPADVGPADLTAERVTEITAQALKKLVGDRPAVIIGHSTGGFMALSLAAHYPEQVAAVASISGFSQGTWTGALGVYQRLARWGAIGEVLFKRGFSLIGLNRWVFRQALRAYAVDIPALYAAPTLEGTLDNIFPPAQQLDLDAMRIWFQQAPHIDIKQKLDRIDVPVLLIVGDQDPIVPPAQTHDAHARIAGSECVVFEGCGHLPMAERADAYNAALTEWLQRTLA